MGLTHLYLGDLGVARGTLEASHSLWAAIGSQAKVANLLCYRGALEESAGDASTAERLYREALALLREAGNHKKVAEALAALGSLLGSLRRVEEARVHLTDALALACSLDAAPKARLPRHPPRTLAGRGLRGRPRGLHGPRVPPRPPRKDASALPSLESDG